jgi:hypothetical protein
MPEIIDKATAIRGRFLKSVQRLRCLLVALHAAGPLRIGYGASPWVAAADVIVNGDG